MAGKTRLNERKGQLRRYLSTDAARVSTIFLRAPHLNYMHAIVFNLTKTEAGRFKSLQPVEHYRSQTYATQVYRTELAHKLQKLGYETESDERTKAPEIKGFFQEYLKASSSHSYEVNDEARNVAARFGLSGEEIENNAGIKQIAVWSNRPYKTYDCEEMKSRSLELEVKFDFEARRTDGRAIENTGSRIGADQFQRNAKNLLDLAKEVTSPSM